jgi:ferredoxin
MMRVRIDANLCSGHGRCAKYAPDVFELNDSDGYNKDRGREIEVPEAAEDAARMGIKSCPERAITIIG